MPNELRVILTVGLVIVLVKLCGCTSDIHEIPVNDLERSTVPDNDNAGDVGDELAELEVAPAPSSIDAEPEPELVHLNVDCYGLGSASGVSKVAVAYDDCDDKTAILAASRIALLASLLIDVWEDWDYPELGRLREHLQTFHVVSVHYESSNDLVPEFARLKFPDLFLEDPELALDKVGTGDAWCKPNGDPRYDIGDEYKFFFVLGSTILTEGWADIVLHEIGHAALFAVYGDPDPNHERDDFWLNHSDLTVMSEVLDRFKEGSK